MEFSQRMTARENPRRRHAPRSRTDAALGPDGASGETPGGCRERRHWAFSSPCLDRPHRTRRATSKVYSERPRNPMLSSTSPSEGRRRLCSAEPGPRGSLLYLRTDAVNTRKYNEYIERTNVASFAFDHSHRTPFDQIRVNVS